MYRRVKLKKETVRKVCLTPLSSSTSSTSPSSPSPSSCCQKPKPAKKENQKTDHKRHPLPIRPPIRHNDDKRLHENLHRRACRKSAPSPSPRDARPDPTTPRLHLPSGLPRSSIIILLSASHCGRGGRAEAIPTRSAPTRPFPRSAQTV